LRDSAANVQAECMKRSQLPLRTAGSPPKLHCNQCRLGQKGVVIEV